MNRPDLPADTLQKNNLFFRQLLFLGILITIGLVILKQLGFFVGAFLGASTLYVVLRPLLFRLTERHSWRSWLAAALLVLCTTVLLLGLGFLIYEVIAAEIPNVDTSKIVGFFEKQVIRLNELIGFEAIPKDLLENSGTFLTKMVSSLINTTYSFAANVFMMLVILYFMLLKGRKMERHINSYVPFKGKSLCLLKQEVKTIIFSNAARHPDRPAVAGARGLPDLLAAGHEQHRFLGIRHRRMRTDPDDRHGHRQRAARRIHDL